MTQSMPIRRVTVRGAGVDADQFPLETVDHENAEVVVAAGPDAVEGAALTGAETPVLAVGVGDGRHGTTREALDTAADALAAGEYRTVSHPILGVTVDGEQVGRAVFDVTLMTSEPARISEYAVETASERLFDVRADGIVVSAPLGSAGYGRAAGGPVVMPDGGLSVVPVSPFSTRASPWVVPGPFSLSVERDEGDVSLFVDTDERQHVDPGDPVGIDVVGAFSCVRPLTE